MDDSKPASKKRFSCQVNAILESPFSPRYYTSLQDPILSQELYFSTKKYKLQNMLQPVLTQELYFPKRKFRLENCTNQQQNVSINSSYHRHFKVINSAKIETAMNCKRMFSDIQFKGFQMIFCQVYFLNNYSRYKSLFYTK